MTIYQSSTSNFAFRSPLYLTSYTKLIIQNFQTNIQLHKTARTIHKNKTESVISTAGEISKTCQSLIHYFYNVVKTYHDPSNY